MRARTADRLRGSRGRRENDPAQDSGEAAGDRRCCQPCRARARRHPARGRHPRDPASIPSSDITAADRGAAVHGVPRRAGQRARFTLLSTRGEVVLIDRFFLSTYAYQIVGRGLPETEVRAANRLATAGLVPDLTLLLDVPAAHGLERADARGKHDRMERSGDDFHADVGNAFRQFADSAWQHSHPECGPIKLIDGTGDEATVHERVVSALASSFPQPFASITSQNA